MDIQAKLFSLSLLVSVIEVCGSNDDGWSMKVLPEVRAMEGYPIVLPCSFTHPHHTLHSSLKVLWRLGHGQGSRVLFQCSTPGSTSSCQSGPEQDQRYRLEGNPRQHDLSLRITNAALQDVGRYYCRVEVPGHAHASYEDKMGTRLRVEAAPRILGLSVEGNEDSGYKALCRVRGSPLPDIQWLSQEKLLQGASFHPQSQDASGEQHTTSQLLDVHPEQQYTCSATNPLGKEQATLYVLSPRPLPAGHGPLLLLLLSISLGAKLLLLLGTGTWMLLGGLDTAG